MPRVISFIVLLAIILLVGAIFFQVMAQFIVPLFLACVLLVVFQPLHAWIVRRFPRHPRISALITTVLILLVVLLPLARLGWNAYVELHTLLVERQEASAGTADETSRDGTTNAAESDVQSDQVARAAPTKNKASAAAPAEEGELPAWINDIAIDLRDDFRSITGITLNDETVKRFVNSALTFVGAKLISGVHTVINILIGLAIMVISLYYFLADGPAMIRTVLHLSPLDASYEKELLERFGQVSRAVVVATLLSAVVQGALAGIGYSFALPSNAPIFLLTALTMVTAMIPFVGAATVWIFVCGYVYLYGSRVDDGRITTDGDPLTAIILALYCTIVVSGIDNVIKPYILHGQSKLHPLLALLSILGGVQVLGPVGILVGPMLVSFLQALLNMLRKELDSFGGEAMELATIVDTTTLNASENEISAVTDAKSAKAASPDGSPAAAAKASPSTAKPRETRHSKRKGRH